MARRERVHDFIFFMKSELFALLVCYTCMDLKFVL